MIERITTHSPAETQALAAALAARLRPPAVLALHGELGSGKTTFVQGLAAAVGIRTAVTSPTFTLIHEYKGHWPLYHVDLYRIHGSVDALGLGLEEYFETAGITVVEWAERADDEFPETALHIRFEPGEQPEDRVLTLTHNGADAYWPEEPGGNPAGKGLPG